MQGFVILYDRPIKLVGAANEILVFRLFALAISSFNASVLVLLNYWNGIPMWHWYTS